jgi:pyruvate dehydrogenase E1 component beta subunit/2-oxoisovalerate dehydrogenase E1 component beta subunit
MMLNVVNDTLVVDEKGIYSLEKFLIARRLMYWQVYMHKTVLTSESLLVNVLKRAKELASEGTEIEVVDLRSVKPLDTDTVMASVARTGRLLCVGEAWPWGGVTAEVVARVASEGFGLLDAPPQRLNAKDTPVPYHPNLWAAHRPTARSIAAAARRLLRL